jgi:hypothetical protein
MRRKHIVVGSDDADVRPREVADRLLVLAGRSETMREIAAGQARTADSPLLLLDHQSEIASPCRLRALDDPIGDCGDGGVEAHDLTRAS